MKVLRFPSTAGFKKYKPFFCKESVSHPAKINLKLLEYIIKTFTEEGDTVLDPMAGTFSTAILSSLLGRDGVGVDLEERFVKMGLNNKALTEKQSSLGKKGSIKIIHGDARELSKLLGVADTIISSPPYSHPSYIDNVDSMTPVAKAKFGYAVPYSSKKSDVIITSPPYSDIQLKSKSGIHKRNLILKAIERGDKVSDRVRSWVKNFDKQKDLFAQTNYSDKVDTIITSPPYSEGLGHNPGTKKVTELGIVRPVYNWDNKAQIGNLKGETYFKAMKKVYSESLKVLKSNGKMILVLKNFIRKKKVVDLVQDTIDLCVSIGFNLTDHILFKLPIQSFWRTLYKQKHPNVDVSNLDYEHILIFQK